MRNFGFGALVVMVGLCACSSDEVADDGGPDGATGKDSSGMDSTTMDTGKPDTGSNDSGSNDSGSNDSGGSDAAGDVVVMDAPLDGPTLDGAIDGSVNTCMDNQKDGLETDVDCGGGICPACPKGKACQKPSDCQSNMCKNMTCQ